MGVRRRHDQSANRVRKVTPEGIITTVAGTGSEGISADGGPATAASLNVPTGVAVDGSGNIYVTVGGRIRRVDRAGIITTLGGSGGRLRVQQLLENRRHGLAARDILSGQ